VNFTGFVAMH